MSSNYLNYFPREKAPPQWAGQTHLRCFSARLGPAKLLGRSGNPVGHPNGLLLEPERLHLTIVELRELIGVVRLERLDRGVGRLGIRLDETLACRCLLVTHLRSCHFLTAPCVVNVAGPEVIPQSVT